MAQKVKTKKKKQAQGPPKKEANFNRTITWPDFPQKLVDIIAKQPHLMQSVSYGGLTKLCISPPSKCYPHSPTPPGLQLLDGIMKFNNGGKEIQPKLNASFYPRWFWPGYVSRWEARQPDGSNFKHWVGYSNDAIVTKGAFWDFASSDRIYLWHPARGHCYSILPEWDEKIPLIRAVQSCSSLDLPNQNGTVMVLTGISRPVFVFCRLREREREWVKQDCTLMEPHCSTKLERKNFMTFTNAIGFNRRFYVLSLQGTLAVIEDSDDFYPPRIIALSSERAVPSVLAKHFKEYLLESEGNILLVFLIYRKSTNNVDDVEVYRLNTTKLSWIRMATLGDRTLFLGTNCCMSVSASRIGCRKNSVYFSYQTVDGWWVFDMENGCISPGWTDVRTKSPFWTEPIQEE